MSRTSTLNFPNFISFSLPFKLIFKLKPFLILGSILAVLFLAFYIFQINSIIGHTYLIKNYEKQLADLSSENKNLEINSAQAYSLESVEALVKNLNYERIEKVRYIQVLENQVVVK